MSSATNKTTDPYLRHKIYVVGGGFEYIRFLFNLGYDGAKGLDDADIVLFTGGEDVNPELYGETRLAKTLFNRLRDDRDQAIYHGALERSLPMVGICRGGQFLNVMNGGKMWQHVTNHTQKHVARIEVPPFLKGNKRRTIEVTSTHHQMMIPAPEAVVVLTAAVAGEKNSPDRTVLGIDPKDPDVEACVYTDTNCLCFQPHPEFGSASVECVDFFAELMDNFIVPFVPTKVEEKPRLGIR